MKLHRQLSMGKLSSAVRDLLRPLSMAKCRELWEGLTVGAHRPADDDDYFRGSYEFSCTTTPVNVLTVKGRRPRRQRRLPPCIGAKQATEMLAGTVVTRRDGGWSPELERSPQAMAALDIDGLAEVSRAAEDASRGRAGGKAQVSLGAICINDVSYDYEF